MTGSPIFSINFKNRKNPANPNYHIVNQSIVEFPYHVFVGRGPFDVRDYFHDFFVLQVGNFNRFFSLDARPIYD